MHTALLILAATACKPQEPIPLGAQMPDFLLEDVNTSSDTFGQNISPRDYQGMASAWYFGHAN